MKRLTVLLVLSALILGVASVASAEHGTIDPRASSMGKGLLVSPLEHGTVDPR